MFNVKDDLLYIGVGDYSKSNYLLKWSKLLIENFNFKINEIRKEGCYTVIYNKDNIYLGKNNVLLVGEAAALSQNSLCHANVDESLGWLSTISTGLP